MKYMLHKLLVILILPFSIHASDVYYCVDDAVTGFDPKQNFARKDYIPGKFKIKIDFEEGVVQSSDLFFSDYNDPKCAKDGYGVLNCIHKLGNSIVISKLNLKYYRSTMFNPKDPSDTITIAHGSCERF